MDMTKASVKRALGLETDTELALFFGTTKQAVGQWGDGKIPEGRQWQARAKRPDLFPAPSDDQEAA